MGCSTHVETRNATKTCKELEAVEPPEDEQDNHGLEKQDKIQKSAKGQRSPGDAFDLPTVDESDDEVMETGSC